MPQYSGVWSLQQQMQALTSGRWATDPLFDYTTLLLQGDAGANGAQNNVFYDTSPNQFAITRNGNTTQGTFSPFSLQPGAWGNLFGSSSTDMLSTASNAAFAFGTGDFTMEAFVFATASQTDNWIIGLANNCWLRVGSGGALEFYNNVTATSTLANTSLPLNQWIHVAAVRSGTTLTIYQNGTSVASATVSTNFSTSVACTIGNQSGVDRRWNGYISNVRIVKGTAVYTSAFTPSPTPLTAITNTSLLTCQNNRFVDNSTNAFSLTVGGTPSVQAFSPFAPQFQYTASGTGGSGYFDGSGDYLSFSGMNVGSSTFTFETWAYFNSTGNYQTLINGGFRLLAFSGSTTVISTDNWGIGGGSNFTVPTLTSGQWYHIAYVKNGTTGRLYLNGVESSTGGVSDTNTYGSGATTYFVGATSGPQYYMSGYMCGTRMVIGTAVYTAAFTPPTAPPTAITNTSLLLNYTNAGILDGTMKNNLETVGNAQVSTSVVKYGSGSMYFDGTGDSLSAPNSVNYQFGSGDFTIEAWVNFSSVSGEKGIVSYFAAGTPNAGFTLRLSTGNSPSGLRFVASGASDVVLQAAWTPSTNTWYHVAVVRLNNTLIAYINGVSIGSTSITITIGAPSAVLAVGTAQTVASSDMNGYIDDLRITKGIARYIANFTPPSVALPRQ